MNKYYAFRGRKTNRVGDHFPGPYGADKIRSVFRCFEHVWLLFYTFGSFSGKPFFGWGTTFRMLKVLKKSGPFFAVLGIRALPMHGRRFGRTPNPNPAEIRIRIRPNSEI